MYKYVHYGFSNIHHVIITLNWLQNHTFIGLQSRGRLATTCLPPRQTGTLTFAYTAQKHTLLAQFILCSYPIEYAMGPVHTIQLLVMYITGSGHAMQLPY